MLASISPRHHCAQTKRMRHLGRSRAAFAFAVLVSAVIGPMVATPADAANTKQANRSTTPTASQRRSLLRAICEGEVTSESCGVCPSYAGEANTVGAFSVGPYHVGAFVTPGAQEAYVGLSGCDGAPAGANAGGVLLRLRGGTWRVVRYDPGEAPYQCQNFPYVTGTTLLVCEGGGGGQGFQIQSVYALYIGPSKATSKQLLAVQSNDGACQKTVDIVEITSWKPANLNGDKLPDLSMSISESRAERVGGGCSEPQDENTPSTYNVGFLFNGKTFTAQPKSKAIVNCLNSQSLGDGVSGTYCG
jgi:hypothetical protein